MIHKEIGSEFWNVDIDKNQFDAFEGNYEFLLSGRTALDFIIKDILNDREIKSAYLPSYCCDSMIKPFLDNGLVVEFYDVDFDEGEYKYHLNTKNKYDVVLIMQYFGFWNPNVESIIESLSKAGKVVIEDATHSWFSENPFSKQSDYAFASFRKWTGLACGAIAYKRDIVGFKNSPIPHNHEFINIRQLAASDKRKYIENEVGEKSSYLELFSKAEDALENEYAGFGIPKKLIQDIRHLDRVKIRDCRISNAAYLINAIQTVKGIQVIKSTGNDAPLFVPIMINNGKRNDLRSFLIQNQVYCPVHWPVTDINPQTNKSLYENSLSIVCDQRYTESDMKRIVSLIALFMETED